MSHKFTSCFAWSLNVVVDYCRSLQISSVILEIAHIMLDQPSGSHKYGGAVAKGNFLNAGPHVDGRHSGAFSLAASNNTSFVESRNSTTSAKESRDARDVPYPSISFNHAEERDFDNNSTELFKAIHARSWEKAAIWLKSEPEQAGIWVYRYEDEGKGVSRQSYRRDTSATLRWRTLPLHGAVIFRAPISLVEALIEANADAASIRDDRGILPVHLALKTGCAKAVVHVLFKAYPEAVDMKDDEGFLPIDLAKNSDSPHRKAYLNAWASTFYSLHNECDFDTNPTALYMYLQKGNWDKISMCRREKPPLG